MLDFIKQLKFTAGRRRIVERLARRFVSLSRAKRFARHIP